MSNETQCTFGPIGAATSPPLQVGDRLSGNYQLTRQLGRGGMSLVFEAEDELLGRRVAIKVCDDPRAGAQILVHEGRALASVRHPGLPVVHGIGLHHGWTFLVLERVYGVTLEEHLERGRGRPLPLEEGLAILAPIAEALAAVHSAGLAHRDLKPANVILSPGRVVLLDFGIVLPEVTARVGDRCGTPRYLAPEMVSDRVVPGEAHLVDTYAFGIMAFEMFSGRAPFEADTMMQLLEHHLSTPPPHLGSRRPDLPRGLCELIYACMAKPAQDRPQDMQAVTWELRNLGRRTEGSGPHRLPPPVARPREVYRRAQTNPALEIASVPWEVLVVDDDPDSRESTAEVLKTQGFRTRLAADGRDALDLIARTGWRPSVILLDLVMPVMDGHQFLATQASDPLLQGIPVVLVTAQPADQARRFASVRGIVPKPVPVAQLLGLLDDVCRQGGAARAW